MDVTFNLLSGGTVVISADEIAGIVPIPKGSRIQTIDFERAYDVYESPSRVAQYCQRCSEQ